MDINVVNNYDDQPPNQEPPKDNKDISLSVISMVLGILSILSSCCFTYIAIILSIISLVLGIISLKNNNGGRGMAIAGIVTSSISIILSIICIIFSVIFLGLSSLM